MSTVNFVILCSDHLLPQGPIGTRCIRVLPVVIFVLALSPNLSLFSSMPCTALLKVHFKKIALIMFILRAPHWWSHKSTPRHALTVPLTVVYHTAILRNTETSCRLPPGINCLSSIAYAVLCQTP
jgi:hypothetical protein